MSSARCVECYGRVINTEFCHYGLKHDSLLAARSPPVVQNIVREDWAPQIIPNQARQISHPIVAKPVLGISMIKPVPHERVGRINQLLFGRTRASRQAYVGDGLDHRVDCLKARIKRLSAC
jgi:hypothetical protein